MRKNTRRFMVYFLSPLVALLIVVVKVPFWADQINKLPHLQNTIAWFIVFGTIYTYYQSIWSPYNDWVKMKKQSWSQLDDAAEKIREKYIEYDLSMNIMIPRRKWLFLIEPSKKDQNKRRLSFTGVVFTVIWSYGSHHVKRKLRFTTRQGACGNAYSEEEITYVDFSANEQDFNFTAKQKELTQSLTMLASYPIFLKKESAYEQEIDVLGVLNVESRTPGANILLTRTEEAVNLDLNMSNLIKAYIKLADYR